MEVTLEMRDTPKQQPRCRLSLAAKRGILVVASFLFAFVIGEITLRVVDKYEPPHYPPQMDAISVGLYEKFDPYGYRLIPSRKIVHLWPPGVESPREISLVSEANGFRSSRALDEPDDRMRIVVVGDSFAFGLGVEENERFTDQLEVMQPSWRIDNLGMTGFGPDLMLRAFEHVGLGLKPDVVVICMYTDDFRRVRPFYAGVGYDIPRFKLEHGQLVSFPYPRPRVWHSLHMTEGMQRAYWKYSSAESDLNAAILDRFLELGHVHGIEPGIVFLPNRVDLSQDKQHRAWLRQYSEDRTVPFLDLTDTLLSGGANKVFIRNDWHLNPDGNRIVATSLRSFLAEQVLKQDRHVQSRLIRATGPTRM